MFDRPRKVRVVGRGMEVGLEGKGFLGWVETGRDEGEESVSMDEKGGGGEGGQGTPKRVLSNFYHPASLLLKISSFNQ